MANEKISELTALTTPAAGDLIPIVDVSDTTDAASGTTKKIAYSDLLAGATPLMVGANGSDGEAGLVPAPLAGDAAKVLSGAGTWVTAAGGGGGGWEPDEAPGSPSALDDEFPGSSLDAKWTTVDSGSTTHAVNQGRYACINLGGAAYIRAITQPASIDSTSGAFDYRAKFRLQQGISGGTPSVACAAGFILRKGTDNAIFALGMRSAGVWKAFMVYWSSLTSGDSYVFGSQDSQPHIREFYLRVVKTSGNTPKLQWSLDGGDNSWIDTGLNGTLTDVGGTWTSAGIVFLGDYPSTMTCEWFRSF